ncbi:MAG: sulfate adenylyltransferase subunit CysN [Gammaproteobacteria bacterium]|nr:sulfate adenylyltransferase subunit CysN [Gammaproteobacteria bacterium]MBU1623877.1 sulfate adenylyltransferase subunit CysN [Gammaproteobacteria bacterium]MBU1982094.1 sulfate adenylyltransferase subunit CysN [Gammaproteobacteria bacterium]
MDTNTQLLRFVTAGSVDDGKSTLIGRLLHDSKSIFEDQFSAISKTSEKRGMASVDLSLLTDGLQAEREQGITIDVAYRYFATPKRKFIIGDTPGHEQYTRNMVTAASTANLAIILIDARKGVLTQTKRHSYLASLLNVPHVVLAVNKMDMVDYSQARFDEIVSEYKAFAAQLDLHDVHCIPLSALNGDMVVDRGENLDWYKGPALLEFLEEVEIDHDVNTSDFRFPVQWVCRPQTNEHHDFRGFAGRIEGGEISVGDEITILPSGRTTTVKEIVTYDGNLATAFAPQSVTLTLNDEIDISRGDMFVKTSAHPPKVEKEFEATLCWLAEAPLDKSRKYLVKHTTRSAKCLFSRLDYRVDVNTLEQHAVEKLNMNDIARVAINVQSPLVFDSYDIDRSTGSFIVIDEANNNTVAAGMIA